METNDLGYFISIYEKFSQAENRSKRTIEAINACVKKFDSFLGGNTNPQNVTAADLRRYIIHLQERCKWLDHPSIQKNHGNLSSNTIAHHARHIKAFWSWMYRERFLEHNPLVQVKTPQVTDKSVTPVNAGEVTQLIKVIHQNTHESYRDSCIIATLYGTLLRITELLDLSLTNVNFTNGQIKVKGKGEVGWV